MTDLKDLTIKKIQNLIELKESLNVEKSVFVLGNTRVKDDKAFYWTPIRRGKNFVSFGVVIFSEDEAKQILEVIDGLVDFIFIDCEKKSKNSNAIGLFNLERLSVEIIKKSVLKFYKGNDLTTEAVDKLILAIFKRHSKLVGGSNILVVGLGNLGFKISLKLVERGANIFILNRNTEKAKKLIDTINLIKPAETIASVKLLERDEPKFEAQSYDIIVLSHLDTIPGNDSLYYSTNSKCVFIDVGKGCLTKSQINYLIEQGNLCLRLDVGDSLLEYIYKEIVFDDYKNTLIPSQRFVNGRRVISTGLIGAKDDIVVDNALNPSFFYGVCDGFGGFKTNLSQEELIYIDKQILKNES